jgi:hypothetical protein
MKSKIARRILLFVLFFLLRAGLAAQTAAPPVSVAVFPLVSTGVPAASAADAVEKIIQNDVATPSYTVTPVTTVPDDFDPAVPPDVSDSTYSFTSQLFYDSANDQTQGQVWLYVNTSETLVVTDQFVYETADQASDNAGFLIEYVLSLIPTYTIKVNTATAGAAQTLTAHGSQKFTVQPPPAPAPLPQAWMVNEKENPAAADGSLTLTLNPDNFPGTAGADDPWGTQVTIIVDAVEEKPPSLETKKTKQQHWRAGLSWLPLLSLTNSGTSIYFGSAFFPAAAEMEVSWMPFLETWGGLGFRVDTGWAWIDRKAQYYNVQTQYLNASAGVVYEAPLLGGIIMPEAEISAGAALTLDRKKVYTDGTINTTPGNGLDLLLSGRLALNVLVRSVFYIKAGASFNYVLPTESFSYLGFLVGLGWRF